MTELKYLAMLCVFAPLLGAITGLFGYFLSKRAVSFVTCTLMAMSMLISWLILAGFVQGKYQTLNFDLYTWAVIGNLVVPVGFLIDNLSAIMLAVVSFISFVVHIYSIGYMQDDPGFKRFFSYISLFTFGMYMLVSSNNYMQLFFGWEAVGLVSYLLIGFWFTRESANFASLKAFIVNRVGDLGFILGIASVFYYCNSLLYQESFAQVSKLIATPYALELICGLLFIGAMAKSAQIPLHVWLPDSMEGPTPISALIHAATMVTAGVFMVARLFPLFEHSTITLTFIMVLGALTCFFMAILGCVQQDIKRIIAYSTISQLGYMMCAFGSGAYVYSIFHLATHAFFKALLFLGAGSVIIAMHHEQNVYKMGNLAKSLPISCVTMLIGVLSLSGFPGTAGFYSKDLLLEAIYASQLPFAKLCYFLGLITVFFTTFYSFRLFFLVFIVKNTQRVKKLVKLPISILLPLIILAIPALLAGEFCLSYVEPNKQMFLHGFISWPFLLIFLGFSLAWLMYLSMPQLPKLAIENAKLLYQILQAKYGFDALNEKVIAPLTIKIGNFCWQIVDELIIDNYLVADSAKGVLLLSKSLRKIQTGYLYHYIFALISGCLLLLVWLYFKFGI